MCESARKLHSQRGNQFNTEKQGTENVAIGASQFLLNVRPTGESAYAKFRKSRLNEKTVQHVDSIPKTRILSKLSTKKEKNDILKETAAFMRNIDYARLRDYSLATLLKHEITSTSFYLTKGGFLRKHKNSELATVIKEPFKNTCLSDVPMFNKKAMPMVDFYLKIKNLISNLIYVNMLLIFGQIFME